MEYKVQLERWLKSQEFLKEQLLFEVHNIPLEITLINYEYYQRKKAIINQQAAKCLSIESSRKFKECKGRFKVYRKIYKSFVQETDSAIQEVLRQRMREKCSNIADMKEFLSCIKSVSDGFQPEFERKIKLIKDLRRSFLNEVLES